MQIAVNEACRDKFDLVTKGSGAVICNKSGNPGEKFDLRGLPVFCGKLKKIVTRRIDSVASPIIIVGIVGRCGDEFRAEGVFLIIKFVEVEVISDITFSLNGVELCTFTSPQDFGERRGRLNPSWWLDTHTQYGQLVSVSVTDRGTFLNGEKKSNLTVYDIPRVDKTSLLFRIENKPDAKNVGGFNLFSRYMGDYEQDIKLTVIGSAKQED